MAVVVDTVDVYIKCINLDNYIGVFSDYANNERSTYFAYPFNDADVDLKNNWKYVDRNLYTYINNEYIVHPFTTTVKYTNNLLYRGFFDLPNMYFLFHFPDEETALYFKLKYC